MKNRAILAVGDAVNIWSNADLPDAALARLRAGTGEHRLVIPAAGRVAASGSGTPDPDLEQAEVAFGQPAPAQLLVTPRLRWLHLSSAGYEAYSRADLTQALRARGVAMTKSSLVYDEPCAQHVLALMLAHARRLPEALANVRGGRAWPQLALRARSQLLTGQSVAIVGLGSIGVRLAELLAPLRMNVIGLRRRIIGGEPVPTFAVGTPEAAGALGAADHIVDLLPASEGTRGFFDGPLLATLKPGAVFYNIGRGSTVDQDALRAALEAGHLAAAYLDVTDPEPLPPDHPLWTTPNCVVTPHTAGGHAHEGERLVQHFLENLARLQGGRPLLDRVL
jgi:phosphoglycerate dehydrogenase-like enzyme